MNHRTARRGETRVDRKVARKDQGSHARSGPRKGYHSESSAPRDTGAKLTLSVNALDYCLRIWEALDCPFSLSCYMLARNGEFEQLVRKGIHPSWFNDRHAADFYRAYQSVKLMSKYPYLDTGIDTQKVAYRKFIACESSCRETNERFRSYDISARPVLHSVLNRMQRKISLILGDVPSLDRLDFSFGPGASYGVRGDTSAYRKVDDTALECTYTLISLLPDFLGEFPGWIAADQASVRLIQGSELVTVPKDATTDRPICIEPNLNGLGQKGIGKYIRGRLLRHGIDLRDQSLNQRLAGLAYSCKLSTIDFASASDTIAYLLVLDLLPPAWVDLLDSFRCPRYQVDEAWYNFQKFSSMGNAYTFELETLIFYAMAVAVCDELGLPYSTGVDVAVYGDDVIVPREAFDLFSEVAGFCGFELNSKKSFREGVFFESCGHDYFAGSLVTPYRLKERIDEPEQAYLAGNNLLRMASRLLDLQGSSADAAVSALSDCHRWLVRQIPRGWKVFGPSSPARDSSNVTIDGYDTHFIAPWDLVCPTVGTFGYRFRRLTISLLPVLPDEWVDSDGSALPKADRHLKSVAWPLYEARGFVPPKWGWLTDDTPETMGIDGYGVRGKTRRKTSWAHAQAWDYPESLIGYFYR